MMLCPWLYHLCLREVTSSSTHQIFWDSSHLWWLLCSPVYYLHGHFSSLRHIRTAHPQQPLMLWLEHQHWALFNFLKFCCSNSMKHNILWQHAFRQVGWSSSSCLGPALRTRLADQRPLQRLSEQHTQPFPKVLLPRQWWYLWSHTVPMKESGFRSMHSNYMYINLNKNDDEVMLNVLGCRLKY